MRSIWGVLLLVSAVLAYDAVIFSSTKKITKDQPTLDELVSSASSSNPLVFLVNPDFILGQFSKAAAAYSTQKSDSSIVNAAKAAKSAESRYVKEAVHVSVPSAVYVSDSATLQKEQPVYVVSADNWSSLDKLAAEVLAVVGDKATVVLTNSDTISQNPVRVKRVSTDDAPNGKEYKFPVLIPRINGDPKEDAKVCLFYLEGLNVVHTSDGSKYYNADVRDEDGTAGLTYTAESDCPDKLATKENGNFDTVFTLRVSGIKADKNGNTVTSGIDIKLTLTTDTTGYWQLTAAELLSPLTADFKTDSGTKSATAPAGPAIAKSLEYVGLTSVFGYSWNCWDSQAIFFPTTDNTAKSVLGVSFHGIQVQVYAKNDKDDKDGSDVTTYFRSKVDSCTGTFSVSSWMGIITSLVLIAVFLFGFLMLNSVQTQDRYDDPKQKQIMINVRE